MKNYLATIGFDPEATSLSENFISPSETDADSSVSLRDFEAKPDSSEEDPEFSELLVLPRGSDLLDPVIRVDPEPVKS